MSLEALDRMLKEETFPSTTVHNKLLAASKFLHNGGEQVIITTLHNLGDIFSGKSGLTIGRPEPSVAIFQTSRVGAAA